MKDNVIFIYTFLRANNTLSRVASDTTEPDVLTG